MEDVGRSFRRKGEVRARRLTQPVDWTTDRGDVLHGKPGDWWVTSPDGAVRSVTPREFEASYQLIEGERYERFGVFRARPVSAVEKVQTLEGPATAYPGDWIVTGPNGNSWPVPDQVFRSGYEPLD